MHFKVGEEVYQSLAAPFGRNKLPLVWMDLMRVPERKWRSSGILVFVYLDNILVLGENAELTQEAINTVLQDLYHGGLCVNLAKSVPLATQLIT